MDWKYLNDVNFDKKHLAADDPDALKKGWSKFIVDAIISQHKDAIFIANEVNCRPGLSNYAHYEYLFHMLPKRKRFGKMTKQKATERVELIMKEYNYSLNKALEIEDLIPDEEIERIKRKHDVGGLNKPRRKNKKK